MKAYQRCFLFGIFFLFTACTEAPVTVPEPIAEEPSHCDRALIAAGTVTDIGEARARWISRDSIVWNLKEPLLEQYVYKLYCHPTGDIRVKNRGIELGEGGVVYGLRFCGCVGDGNDSPADKKLPYLSYLQGRTRISTASIRDLIPELLTGGLVVAIEDEYGLLKDASYVQTAGVLDDLYTYRGELGVVLDIPVLKIWAPTAKSVKLHLYESATIEEEMAGSPIPMAPWLEGGKWTGVWYAKGYPQWKDRFYLYEVEVFAHRSGRVEKNMVTDPYSLSLSMNSRRSQICDLDDPGLKPKGWDELKKPYLEAIEDTVIYELHLRDFSIGDTSVPALHRGTFMAFTHKNSRGMQHLKSLAQAGLTHVHLLPVFDIATIEENRGKQSQPQIPRASSHSLEQQRAVEMVKDRDGFNWGYDPFHYLVPEGSYSTDPDGSRRILEFREMVQSLNEIGLRVVMDVVFNHTHAAGDEEKSVLDKIVPGYYYRLDDAGNIERTSCCPDTASEHAMMEKLMEDALLLWVRQYKIDGFRFDLMGHHTRSNMLRIRETLDSLTVEHDGVDGKKIYVYGEAWKFGSLDAMLPDEAFHQMNTFGCGIGTFNDRLRDCARGGSPFSALPSQGFITGLYCDFNREENQEVPDDLKAQREMLLNYMDNIRIGMAGNLRDYCFTGAEGFDLSGAEVQYRGKSGAGYTAQPREIINYISVHDNHTLWDCIEAKAPFRTPGRSPATATIEERVAMHNLGISLIALSQGIPFFHAGCDMLRSKSGDADSYNSGDWFNRLDFTYESNNWGVGLPSAEKNRGAWEFWKPRLGDPSLKPGQRHILQSVEHLKTMLNIRKSSRLFRLRSADEIIQRVRFLNAEKGREQIPGLIAMAISDTVPGKTDLDPKYDTIVIFFNADRQPVRFQHDALKGLNLALHPALKDMDQAVFDSATGAITIAPRTTVVYCQPQH